jgi:hypothetical protein
MKNRLGAFTGVLIPACVFLSGCFSHLNPPDIRWMSEGGGLVRIEIGDADGGNARTVQPQATALAGYRLTFSGGQEHIDITGKSSADIYLPDGTHTITAAAYKASGEIGNPADRTASGSISVTLSGGVVTSNGGIVPAIILVPRGPGKGTLQYTITGADAVSGTMKLWDITGINPVMGFGSSGVLSTGASPTLSAQTVMLTTDRYIAEIRLVNANGNIALLQEIVEIWTGTITALVFEPEGFSYLDPSAVLAYSGASLSGASAIGGAPIGTPSEGNGENENDPLSYTLILPDISSADIDLVPENDSLFADISWIETNGNPPGGTGYAKEPKHINFSNNAVLWVKVVSEDSSTTKYYKFSLSEELPPPIPPPSSIPPPSTNEEHLAMLRNLNVNVNNPALAVAPNGLPYNPEKSIGPLGKIYSFPKREIFVAGYAIQGSDNALYEDLNEGAGSLRLLASADHSSGWAYGYNPKKSAAVDLDGDGIDEVITITAIINSAKLLVTKASYTNGYFSAVTAATIDDPDLRNDGLWNGSGQYYAYYLFHHTAWNIIAADLNGDGKQECVFTRGNALYILDNNLTVTKKETAALGSPSALLYNPKVAAADYDQDGKDELCVMLNGGDGPIVAMYVILDDKDAGFTELSRKYIYYGAASMRSGNLATGDFDGDGLPDTAFFGLNNNVVNPFYSSQGKVLMLLKTIIPQNSFCPEFEWVETATTYFSGENGPIFNHGYIFPRIAAGDVDGDRKADVVVCNQLWTLSNNHFTRMSNTGDSLFSFSVMPDHFERFDFMIGDVTGDMKGDVVMFFAGGQIGIYYYSDGEYRSFIGQAGSGSMFETGCLPNVDDDSFILKDTGERQFLFSDPAVLAVLASPPYYKGINDHGDGRTSFGYGTSSTSTTTNNYNVSYGISVGFKLTLPFDIGETEFETSITKSVGWTQSKSKKISESYGWYGLIGHDIVIFAAIPIDVYFYEVLRAPRDVKENTGQIITVSIPRRPITTSADVSVYNAGVPEEFKIKVNHTLGDPESYYSSAQADKEKALVGNRGMFSTNSLMSVGISSGTSNFINLKDITEEGDSFNIDSTIKISGKARLGVVVVGENTGFSYGYKISTSVTQETWIEGRVPGIPAESAASVRLFDWGLMAYPAKGGNTNQNKEYVFVTYWVNQR